MSKETAVLNDIIMGNKKEVSDFSQVVDTLLNNKWKRRKTILNNRQVTKLTTIDVISQIYKIVFLQQWVNHFAEWRTSGDNGKGRKDIVEITKFQYASQFQAMKGLMGEEKVVRR